MIYYSQYLQNEANVSNFNNFLKVLLKKLEALVLDIENFSSKIEKLDALNQGLVARDHFDKENIKKHQTLTEMRSVDDQDCLIEADDN